MESDTNLSPVRAARRDKLLDAAKAVFLRAGLKGATMEAIAEEAGVSKVTLYGYFRDKDAAFFAVSERLAGQLRAATFAALDEPGTPADRITRALQIKHGMVRAILQDSPLADELIATRQQVQDIWQSLDAEITARLTDVIGDADTARIIFDASLGISENAKEIRAMKTDIARLVAALTRP